MILPDIDYNDLTQNDILLRVTFNNVPSSIVIDHEFLSLRMDRWHYPILGFYDRS